MEQIEPSVAFPLRETFLRQRREDHPECQRAGPNPDSAETGPAATAARGPAAPGGDGELRLSLLINKYLLRPAGRFFFALAIASSGALCSHAAFAMRR